MNKIFRDIRQQPLVSAITILGTALSIFIIMIVVTLDQVKEVSFAPESGRHRMLYWKYGSIRHDTWNSIDSSNGPLSYTTYKNIFSDLETAEAVTATTYGPSIHAVGMVNNAPVPALMHGTDDGFFRVYNFTFTQGAPYSNADFEARRPVAVLCESMAREIFHTTDNVVGREFLIDMAPYTVCGVVKDVSQLATKAYAEIWIPLTSNNLDKYTWSGGHMGGLSVAILCPTAGSRDEVRAEIIRRFEAYNSSVRSSSGYEFIRRNRPYDIETEAVGAYANSEPDLPGARKRRAVTYLVLLLVPSIALSSITRSRLSRRRAEFAVRRAFGASSARLTLEIITENFLLTLLAGGIGLILSVATAWLLGASLFYVPSLSVSPAAVMHWSIFGWALLFCFVINLLCSAWPAWQSAHMGIAESLSGRKQ